MPWFHILKYSTNRTNWNDDDVWDDLWDVIDSFIRLKGKELDMVESGNYTAKEFRVALLNIWQMNVPGRAPILNAIDMFLQIKGSSDKWINYRQNASVFGQIGFGNPKTSQKVSPVTQHKQYDAGFSKLVAQAVKAGSRSSYSAKKSLGWMRATIKQGGLNAEIKYALKLLHNIPKKDKSKEEDLGALMQHIEDTDYCKESTEKLVNRAFDFNTPTPMSWGRGLRLAKPHRVTSWELKPIKDLVKEKPINIDKYMKMYRATHPKAMSDEMFEDMWGDDFGHHQPTTNKGYYTQVLRPYRTRLLLIHNYYQTCIGNYTLEEFKGWALQ